MKKIIFLLCLVMAFASSAAAADVKTKTIDEGGSGPYKAIAVEEPSMTDWVIYRPRKLADAAKKEGRLPILIFANGGCMNTSVHIERMLNEVASRGYIVVAIGELQMKAFDRKETGTPSSALLEGLDRFLKLCRDRKSVFALTADTTLIAAAGHSCGGAQVLYSCGDPRLTTCLILNAGMGDMQMADASRESLLGLHTPVVYMTGGKGDVAYNNASLDYQRIHQVPVVWADDAKAGHGATYAEPYGGTFGRLVTRWLDWQLKGKSENAAIFLDGKSADFPEWTFRHKDNAVKDRLFDSSTASTRVQTRYGDVSGFIDHGIYCYKGLPYARASRFEEPQKPKPWQGVRSSRWYGYVCPQSRYDGWRHDENAFFYRWNEGFQDEDCLRLNIWTPEIARHTPHAADCKLRPVLVWLHGGGFSAGNGQDHPGYDGRNLADKGDVVVVTLNHRLNCLGYLDLSAFGKKYQHTGNLGQLDIVAALQWIKENIASFGGDPGCVTIFGQSGGGGKVSALCCMPSAKGLFHRAMVMSGSGMKAMRRDAAQAIGRRTAELLGLDRQTIDSIEVVPYERLSNAASQAMQDVQKNGYGNSYRPGFLMWGPVADDEVLPGIFENNAELVSNAVPMIIGSTLNEFTGNKTDQTVRPAVVAQAKMRCNDKAAPVWVYHFRYEVPTMDGRFHACHNSDIAFFMDNVVLSAPMTGATPEGIALGDTMSSYLVNFARTGNPNGNGLMEWKPFSPDTEATMLLNDPCKMEEIKDRNNK
jgi:para-nitrobenzyl esterase